MVVTLGAEGALASREGEWLRVPAAPLPGQLVDTTGCGDAFAGTFLVHHAGDASLEEALAAAGRRAAEVATHRGACR